VIAHHNRLRIIAGAAQVFAAQGYRQVAVADIVSAAAIARSRFYENFSSKQDCFLAVYERATETSQEQVRAACDDESADFPSRVRLGIRALITWLESDPDLARAAIVQGPAVGRDIGDRFEAMISAFAGLLRESRGDAAPEFPDTVEETVVGGLYWQLYYALLDNDGISPDQLERQLVEFALIPFLGVEGPDAAARG
jgi:AcrR family transcriptional regulator